MTLLLSLEPQGLRRLLKAGLRQGIADSDLHQLIADAFALSIVDDVIPDIIHQLECRGWLSREGAVWKTRLGRGGC